MIYAYIRVSTDRQTLAHLATHQGGTGPPQGHGAEAGAQGGRQQPDAQAGRTGRAHPYDGGIRIHEKRDMPEGLLPVRHADEAPPARRAGGAGGLPPSGTARPGTGSGAGIGETRLPPKEASEDSRPRRQRPRCPSGTCLPPPHAVRTRKEYPPDAEERAFEGVYCPLSRM